MTRLAFVFGCVALALLGGAAPARADLAAEIRSLSDEVVYAWRAQQGDGDWFPNPQPAEVAVGHTGFAPPELMFAMQAAGERLGDSDLIEGAERAWPFAVGIDHASTFDVFGAAYAYNRLRLSARTRDRVAAYLRGWGVPTVAQPTGCAMRPDCHHNLVLVDGLAVLSALATGLRSTVPGNRLTDAERWRQHAEHVFNVRVPQVIDHRLRARLGRRTIAGSLLSDPPRNQVAYHALSTLMVAEALKHLGPRAGLAAHQALRETLDALTVLVGPDGDLSYMGRGQGQVWVPAVTVAAMVDGAALTAPTDPGLAAGYLAVARRALWRLRALHLTPVGFRVVPGRRTTYKGMDPYVHTVAYNALALFALTVAGDTAATLPPLASADMPADHMLRVVDPSASSLAIAGTGRTWLAVHSRTSRARDLRYGFGLLALKHRRADGTWHDLLAPRPRAAGTAGPVLVSGGPPAEPRGRVTGHARTLTIAGHWRGRHRRTAVSYRPRRDGATIEIRRVRKRQRFGMLVFTPAGTGGAAANAVLANHAVWCFPGPIQVRRITGVYHSGPVENLDAFDVSMRARHRGRLRIAVTDATAATPAQCRARGQAARRMPPAAALTSR
jgi:hypothetical protein